MRVNIYFPFPDSAYVQIIVTDENDNPPIFEYKRYNATVKESRAIETSILVVRATDADEGKSISFKMEMVSISISTIVFQNSNLDLVGFIF